MDLTAKADVTPPGSTFLCNAGSAVVGLWWKWHMHQKWTQKRIKFLLGVSVQGHSCSRYANRIQSAWSVRQTSVSEEKLSRWLSKRVRSLAWSESALTWRDSEQLTFYTSSGYGVVFQYSFILYLLCSQSHPVQRGNISLLSCVTSYVQQLVINLFCHVMRGRSHRAKRKGRKELLKVQYVVSWRNFNQKRKIVIQWFLFFLFVFIDKQTDLNGCHHFILFYSVYMWRTLPLIWLQTVPFEPYFPLRTACLFTYGK